MIDRCRIVVCRGVYCNEGRRADHLLKVLTPLVEAHNGEGSLPQIKIETANCLSMCGAGPNIMVYPEQEIYNRVQTADLPRILSENT